MKSRRSCARLRINTALSRSLPYSYGGTLGALNYGSMDRRFFHRLGASQLDRTICSSCRRRRTGVRYGREKLGNGSPKQFSHAAPRSSRGDRTFTATNVHLWPFIEEAPPQGRAVDRHRSVQNAHREVLPTGTCPLIPAPTSRLGAGAMMHVIINEGLYDADYVSPLHTLGFDELKARAYRNIPLDKVAHWTGIPGRRYSQAGDGIRHAAGRR